MNELVHIFVDTPNVLYRNNEGPIPIKIHNSISLSGTGQPSVYREPYPFSHIDWSKLFDIIRRGSRATFGLFIKGTRYAEAKLAKRQGFIPECATTHFPRKGKDVDAMLIGHMFDTVSDSLLKAHPSMTVRVAVISGDGDFSHTLRALRNLAGNLGRNLEIEMYSWRAFAPDWESESHLLDVLKGGFCYLDSLQGDIVIQSTLPQKIVPQNPMGNHAAPA